MALGDDQVFPCGCGFDDVSSPHVCFGKKCMDKHEKKCMDKHEKVANIIAFLSILFGEKSEAWESIMELSPEYIIEKFERYVESSRIEHPWGMHPVLRMKRFQRYVDMWSLELAGEQNGVL